MKKLIAMISAIAIIGTMSLTSFAEITVTPNPELTTAVTLEKGESGGYDASYTSDDVNTQTTIVAVKGTEIKTSSIQYINQLTQDSETVINFDLKDELAVGEIVTVYMGGDAIDKTKIGTIALPFTITFYDEDGTELQKAEYVSGDPLVAPTNLKTEDETHYYEFVGWALKATPETVITPFPTTVTENAEYVAVYNKTEKEVGGGETVAISYQMVLVATNGATVDEEVIALAVNSGDVIYETAAEPVLSGYSFIGWYTDSALTTKLAKDATLTATTTIYAKMAKAYVRGNLDQDANGIINKADATVLAEWVGKRKPAHDWLGKTVPGSTEVFGNVDGDINNIVNKADATVLAEWVGKRKPAGTNYADVIAVTKD